MGIKSSQNVLVIGGGIHGIASALALSENGMVVTLVEMNSDILQGTSNSTHNRAHLGYHYPRSLETAVECIEGLELFRKKYPGALYSPPEAYYFIDKTESKTTTENYIKFCREAGIPCNMKYPSTEYINKDSVDSSFLVTEPVFDLNALRMLVERDLVKSGVRILRGAKVVGAALMADFSYLINVDIGGKIEKYGANAVINATYARTNNVQRIFGVSEGMTKYSLQTTEVVVAQSDKEIPALTVMDGPFISVMPYAGHNGLVLVYDVVHSVTNETAGYFYDDSNVYDSNWPLMVEHGAKYYPFMKQLKYTKSLWGSRPVPIPTGESKGCRKTRLKDHKDDSLPGFYSILEGKFISAFSMTSELIKLVQQDCLI